ncbi:MAG: hypothetical protein ACR2NB_15865 [Solirubrobacteraceae bacterium]
MRRLYGSSPLHLIGNLLAFALAGYAIAQILGIRSSGNAIVWLVGAILLHDVVLWPIYSGADTLGQRLLGGAVNYVRVPLGLSLMLALAFAATLSNKGENVYHRVSGLSWDGYVLRWLVVSAALFVVSGVVYLLRSKR